jgi:hypothetical protein
MHKKSEDTIRLSIVCYLRKNVWLNSKNKTRKFVDRHNHTVKAMRRANNK